jgi:iron complex outermembrane receptor protein
MSSPRVSEAIRPVPKKKLAIAVSAAISLAASGAASSQVLEEVIVTATKRAESIMEVPLAITAVSGEMMRDTNLDDVKDLIAYTPGVTGNSKDSFIDFVSVRGILTNDFGIGGDPSVGLYKNNLYQGRNGAAVTSLYDIERAEILRGRQGFLFGRGAISGAMNIFTTKPSTEDMTGYAEVDLGERGHGVAEGAVNIPLGDHLAFRVAGYHSEEDGYVRNRFPGDNGKYIEHEMDAVRFSGLFQTERLEVNLMLEYEEREQSGSIYVPTGTGEGYEYLSDIYGDLGYPGPDNEVNADMSLGNEDGGEIFSLGLQIDYDMGFATLTSITGYRDHEFLYAEDFDGLPLILNSYAQDQEGDYFEQELRLVSNGEGPLSWYAGVSYYEEDIEAVFSQEMSEDFWCSAYWAYYDTTCEDLFAYYKEYADYYPDGEYVQYFFDYFGTFDWQASPTGTMVDRNRAKGKYEGYAAYFDLSYDFSEKLDASLGVRYTKDEKDFSNEVLPTASPVLGNRAALGFSTPEGPLSDSKSWDDWTPRLIVNFRPDEDSLIFGSVTAGYKPGGFNSLGLTPALEFGFTEATPDTYKPASFDPEKSISYEVGYKGNWFEGRTQVTANAFFYEYEDLQLTYYDGALFFVDNVGEVDGYGFEGSVIHSFNSYLLINAGLAWFDSEANELTKICGGADVCEGRSLPHAPEWSGHLALNGNYPLAGGELFGMLAYHFQTEQYGGFEPGSFEIDGYGELNLSVGFRGEWWSVQAYVDNVTDEYYYDGGYNGDSVYPDYRYGPSRPRTAGVKFGVEF